MTKAEQETVIGWNEEDKLVHLYSSSPLTWRKAARLGFEVREETNRAGERTGRFYVAIPLAEFTWRRKRPKTAAQIESARQNAKRLRPRAQSTEVGGSEPPDEPTGEG
jgi:hypothetical protein